MDGTEGVDGVEGMEGARSGTSAGTTTSRRMRCTVRDEGATRGGAEVDAAALLVVHGMGQQERFATLDAFTRGLADAARRAGSTATLEHVLEERDGSTRSFVRVQLDRPLPSCGATTLDVHESYWAPASQRKLKTPRVLAWLVRTSLTPLRSWATNPDRLGDRSTWSRASAWDLARELLRAAMLPLLLLVLLAPALWLLPYLDEIVDLGDTAADALPGSASAVVGIAVAALLAGLGIMLLLAAATSWFRSRKGRAIERATFRQRATAALVASAVAAIAAVVVNRLADPSLVDYVRAVDQDLVTGSLGLLVASAVLAGLVRKFLVDALGDVTIYVTADEKSDLYETRAKILDESATAAWDLLERYGAVFVAGHSLGSVIAYDTVNRLQQRARGLGNDPQRLAYQRLRGLFTFGSPLDKIEYFFRTRTKGKEAVRAQILASLDGFARAPTARAYDPYRFERYDIPRPDGFWWTNVYALMDPVSGRLDRYLPDEQCRMTARVPLAAHTRYWKEPAFFDKVFSRL